MNCHKQMTCSPPTRTYSHKHAIDGPVCCLRLDLLILGSLSLAIGEDAVFLLFDFSELVFE